MRLLPTTLVLAAAALAFIPAAHAQVPAPAPSASPSAPLIVNGNFDDPTDPLKGWITDYEWEGNSHYIGNKKHVSIVTEGARKNVVKFDNNGDDGVKMECRAFPIEPGFKYICTMDVKCEACRIYFAGYQWKPGVHPHDNPELGELRMIYKSKAAEHVSKDWAPVKIELPGVALSPQALEFLKKLRYLTVYIWMAKPGFVDNVTVTKVADPSMKF